MSDTILVTAQHSIDVLHVQVPESVDGEVFCGLMEDLIGSDSALRLKHGFTISDDDLEDALGDSNMSPNVREFLLAVQAECEGTSFTPDEYFFYRY